MLVFQRRIQYLHCMVGLSKAKVYIEENDNKFNHSLIPRGKTAFETENFSIINVEDPRFQI